MRIIGVIKRAAQIFWHNKLLWSLGVLVFILRGLFSAAMDIFYTDGEEILLMHREWANLVVLVQERIDIRSWIGWVLLVCYILFFVFKVILALGLFRAAAQFFLGEEREKIWVLMNCSRKQFWSMLGLGLYSLFLQVLLLAPGAIIIYIIYLMRIVMSLSSTFVVLIISIFLVYALVISIYLGLVQTQGAAAMVIENLGAVDAFDRGHLLIKKNLNKFLLVWLFLGLLTSGYWAVTALPYLDFTMPQISTSIPLSDLLEFLDQTISMLRIDIAPMRPLFWWPVMIVVEGLLAGFKVTVWTVIFLEHRGEPEDQKPELPELATA